MQQWEYMWIYVDDAMGKQVYVANGERLQAQTYQQALNEVGKDGWELAIVPSKTLAFKTQSWPQFA
jgi:hypothetical protein